MKDHFLYNLRQEPAQELTRAVYRDVARLPENESTRNTAHMTTVAGPAANTSRRRVFAFAALAVLVLFIFSSITSPRVRALVDDVVRQIGGLSVRETAIYPLSDGYITVPDENQYLTMEDARQAVNFEFSLPAELPDRYLLRDEIIVGPDGNSVDVRWRGQETRGDALSLSVSPANPEVNYLVGSDGIEVIEINGQEAVFIHGGWLQNTESWDTDISRGVRWVHNDLTYHLSAGGQFSCPDEPEFRCPLGDEDLIRIAESVN